MGILRKAISSRKDIVISVIDATSVVAKSMEQIQAYPPSMVHLGQAMMGASLLQSLWNDKGLVKKVTLQWRVDGPFGHVFSESNEKGQVRGTILYPQAPVDNYEAGLGRGHLQVQRFETTDFTGIVEAHGNICTDLLDYLSQSEQRNCTIALSVKVGWQEDKAQSSPFQVEYALGYLIDVLPQKNLEESQRILKNWDDYLSSLGPISQWNLPHADKTEAMLKLLSPGETPKEILFQKIEFHCNCSEERASRAARLSEKMADDNEEPGQSLQVQCEFCGKIYHLKAAES